MQHAVELLEVGRHHGHEQHVHRVRAEEAKAEQRAVVRGERLVRVAQRL